MRYTKRPRPARSDVSYAAQYKKGESLTDLLEVAQWVDSSAELAEVPSLAVLVVSYLKVPEYAPAEREFEVVPDGHFLVYSQTYDLLVAYDAESFHREHQLSQANETRGAA